MSPRIRWGALGTIAILCLIGVTPLFWLGPQEIANGGDIVYPLDPLTWLNFRTSMWEYRVNAGTAMAVNATTLSFHFVQALLALFGFAAALTQKLSYVFWNVLICAAIYGLITMTEPPNAGRWYRWIGVGIFAFNPFLFNTWESGKTSILSAFVNFPWTMILLVGVFRRGWRLLPTLGAYVLLSAVTQSVGADPPVCALLILMVLLAAWMLPERPSWKTLGIGALFLLAFMLTCASWIFPFGYETWLKSHLSAQRGLEAFQMADWLGGISTHTSLFNVARLQGTWDWYYTWNGEAYIPYAYRFFTNPLILGISLLWPIAAYGALFTTRDRVIWFFVTLALIGTIGGAGAHAPTGPIFLWLTNHMPGFFVFRSPYYKFGILLPLAYAILVPRTWLSVVEWLKRRRGTRVPWKPITAGLLLAANVVYAWPMLTGSIIPKHRLLASIRLTVPEYVMAASRWFTDQLGAGRILSLPQDLTDMYDWGYGSLVHLLSLMQERPIVHGMEEKESAGRIRNFAYQTLYAASTPYATALLDVLGIRYLLLRGDSRYDFYGDTDSPAFIEQCLRSQTGTALRAVFGPWKIFEVTTPLQPRLRVVRTLLVAEGPAKALIPWTYLRELHDTTAFLRLADETQRQLVTDLLSAGQGLQLMFYESSLLDLALNLMPGARRTIPHPTTGTWDLDIAAGGPYEFWIARGGSGEPTKLRGLFMDDQHVLLPTETRRYGTLEARRWLRLTPALTMASGQHRLKAIGWNPGDPLPELIVYSVVPGAAWVQHVLERVRRLPSPIILADTARMAPSPEGGTESVRPSLILQPVNVPPAQSIEGQGDRWRWLQPTSSYLLVNMTPAPQRIDLRLEVYSPLNDCTFYIYLNKQLLTHRRIPALAATPVTIEGVELPVGDQELTCWVLEGSVPLLDPGEPDPIRQVTVAIRDLSIGSTRSSSLMMIPRSGQYLLHCYPFPLDHAPPNTHVEVDDAAVLLADEMPGQEHWGGWVSEQPLTLAEGPHRIVIDGHGTERYHLVLEELLPKPAHPPEADEIRWVSPHPTRYQARLTLNGQGPWFLVLRDAFHVAWDAVRHDGPGKPSASLADHFEAEGYANAWRLKTEGACEIDVTYRVQAIFRLGGWITAAVIGLGLSFLLTGCVGRRTR